MWKAAFVSVVLALGFVLPGVPGQTVTSSCVTGEQTGSGPVRGGPHYDVGSPAFTDIWVAPAGDDGNSATSRSAPLATLAAAWARIPTGTLTRAYRVRLVGGSYAGQAPFLEDRHGTRAAPIVIQSELGGAVGGTPPCSRARSTWRTPRSFISSTSPFGLVATPTTRYICSTATTS